ncbi:metal-sulfur cluster assembly factor [Euryarchaeota archaeon]|nr:metal-sulfur cluster assembly factor [Euryarchaeota archaeon]|tara:strand:- start:1163 stop:1465 length:303 start_codon:yes stop_codon:yes gene_type:complete
MVEEEEIMKFLANVEDPEMKISVIDLGLIYGLKIESAHVEIDMTLTSPGCPVAPELMAAVHRAALMADGIESAHVNLTFSPLWDPRVHASEDAKLDLGIF